MRQLMTTYRRLVAVLAAIVLVLTLSGQPAHAGTRIVYVDVAVPSAWSTAVASSIYWVDLYTGSDMRYGPCRSGYKCITIRERLVYSSWAAVTYGYSATFSSSTRVLILLNPQRRWYSWAAKRSIVDHELGHANGVTWHSVYCTNVMYSRVFCPSGALPARRFTDPARQRLAVN